MRRWPIASSLLLALLYALRHESEAAAAPAASAAPVSYCPFSMAYVLQPQDVTRFNIVTFGLRTDSSGGMASGILTVYSGDDRYDVPFSNVRAAGFLDAGDDAEPIAIAFDHGVRITAAYVSKMLTPEPFTCPVGMVWTGYGEPEGGSLPRPVTNVERIERDPSAKKIIDAPEPAHEAHPTCDTPTKSLGIAKKVDIPYPALAGYNRTTGDSYVQVLVTSDGKAGGINLFKSSGDAELDAHALRSALANSYAPEIFRCKPVFGEYYYDYKYTIKNL